MRSMHIDSIEREQNNITSRYHYSPNIMNPCEYRKGPGALKESERNYKVTRENVSSGHAPNLINQFAAPPPIFRRSSDSDDIVGLKIELLRDRRLVVIKRAHFTIIVNKYISLALNEKKVP